MTVAPKTGTLVETLRALETCTRWGARFVAANEEAVFYPYREVLRRAQSAAAAFQEAGLQPGERVAVILPTSIEFFDAYLGAQLAGGTPAALYPPFRLGRLDEYFARLRRMLAKIGARFLVTEGRIKRLIGPGVVGVDSLEQVIEAKDLHSSAPWRPVERDPDAPAFLQFSSGTTVEPKAVVMTHNNLLHNLEMMQRSLVYRAESEVDNGCVCWLPLYHDMGLVGCLYLGLYYPGTVTYMGPDSFLMKPALWLRTLSRYGAAISPAPHFAYSLCVNKIRDQEMEDVDLSRWRGALNGAEPIDPDGLERFAERFARWGFQPTAMVPVYGLAEAGLAVSFSDIDDLPVVTEFDRDALSAGRRAVRGPGRRLVAVGAPLPGVRIEIQDDNGAALPEGGVGRILIQGPSITQGYFEDPELTAQIIRDGWLDTGDQGFFFEGQLYISGRVKDLIILRGRNYAPQEFEDLIFGIEGLRPGCAVALGMVVDGQGEQLLILAERDARSRRAEEETAAEVKSRILAGLALIPWHIELLAPGTLPRTSSGKLRRGEALRQFLAGELTPPEKVNAFKLLLAAGKSQLAWTRWNGQKK